MIKIHDLFIGSYNISQFFGARPEVYAWIKDVNGASIRGHNGVDFATPNGTQLINPFPKNNEVVISAVGEDINGYGKFLRIWDKTQGCVMLYAHCQEVKVAQGDRLYFQQLIALSDNTGWSSGPHLHASYYLVDAAGNKLNRTNGFDGWMNLLDKNYVMWDLLNPLTPGSAPDPSQLPITITAGEHTKLVTIADNYQRVLDFIFAPDKRQAYEVGSDAAIAQIDSLEKRDDQEIVNLKGANDFLTSKNNALQISNDELLHQKEELVKKLLLLNADITIPDTDQAIVTKKEDGVIMKMPSKFIDRIKTIITKYFDLTWWTT